MEPYRKVRVQSRQMKGLDGYSDGLCLRPERKRWTGEITPEINPPWIPGVRVSPSVVRRRKEGGGENV